MNAGLQRSIHDEGNSHATICAKTGGAKEGESVPDVYLTWAVLAVVATEAARKISNLRAFDRLTDFYPPLKGSYVCVPTMCLAAEGVLPPVSPCVLALSFPMAASILLPGSTLSGFVNLAMPIRRLIIP